MSSETTSALVGLSETNSASLDFRTDRDIRSDERDARPATDETLFWEALKDRATD